MAAMSKLQQLGASATGCVESAYIIVYDYRKAETDAGKPVVPDFMADSSGMTKAVSGAEKAEISRNISIKNAMDTFQKNAASSNSILNSTKSLQSLKSGTGGISKIFRLQFNPSQFQVYASALPVNETDTQGKHNVINAVQAPGLTLSTSFWFDQSSSWDCFPGDKFNGGLAPTNIAKTVTSIAQKKPKPSVQQTVEAFIAALRDPYTRMVSFRWSDFVFTGEILSIGANYTMFASDGTPVRAELALRIQQKQDLQLLKPWFECFNEEIATIDPLVGKSYTNTQQKLGSLLNITR